MASQTLRKFILASTVAAATLLGSAAQAGVYVGYHGYYGHGYDRHGYYGGYRGGYRGHYRRHGHGHRHHRYRDVAAGLVLGAIIGGVINHHREPRREVVYRRPVSAPPASSPPVKRAPLPAPVRSETYYRIDRDGNCWLIGPDADGNQTHELRPSIEC